MIRWLKELLCRHHWENNKFYALNNPRPSVVCGKCGKIVFDAMVNKERSDSRVSDCSEA